MIRRRKRRTEVKAAKIRCKDGVAEVKRGYTRVLISRFLVQIKKQHEESLTR